MLLKPRSLLDREDEWNALARFVERDQRLALVYGPRRVGKSFLLDALCRAGDGRYYQAVSGAPRAQLDDFGRVLGAWLGAGRLALADWADALDRLAALEERFVVVDELPYLTESSPELATVVQRYVDSGAGPALILSGSSVSVMTELVASRAPLRGRAAAVVVPRPFAGHDLARLWRLTEPRRALWVDAAMGGLPGYRPLLEPPGRSLDAWMVGEVLASSSPLLDASEAALADTSPQGARGLARTILAAIAAGERTFSGIARVAGRPTGALGRPLAALEHAGLVTRVGDPLRSRRDLYELADPHLRLWLSIIAPNRSALQAGRARQVWRRVESTTWRDQVLGPRWEAVVREHVASSAEAGSPDVVGTTAVSDRSARTTHQVDIVAVRGGSIVALGEAKLRRLGMHDLARLRRIRALLAADGARLVLGSATGVDASVAREPDVTAIGPRDVYRRRLAA